MKHAAFGGLLAVGVLVCSLASACARATPESAGNHRPKTALDARAIATAKRITVHLSDLPPRELPPRASLMTAWFTDAQWKPGLVNKKGLSLACAGHVPDESSVTFKGGWSSQFDRRVDSPGIWILTSAVVVLETPRQARLVFHDTTAWAARFCFVSGNRSVASFRRVRPPRVADQQAEFRIRWVSAVAASRKLGSTIVLLRRGRIFIELTLDWRGKPPPAALVDSLAEKVAGRAGQQ